LRETIADGTVQLADACYDAPDIAAFIGKAFNGRGFCAALGFQTYGTGRG